MGLLDQDPSPEIQTAASLLPPVHGLDDAGILGSKNATYLRNDLLDDSNLLTKPKGSSIELLQALALRAYLLTRAGSACTVRRAGELALLQDEREQKEEAVKMIRTINNNGPKSDDKYWIRARNEVLWLRDWGAEEYLTSAAPKQCNGVFGQVSKEFLEVEILKALLANTRKYASELHHWACLTWCRVFRCSISLRRVPRAPVGEEGAAGYRVCGRAERIRQRV